MRPGQNPITTLRRVMSPARPVEHCDFCHTPLADRHPHVMALSSRQLSCACGACAVLFSGDGSTKYRRVPQRARYLSDFHITDAQWESLSVPIGLAFFVHSSTANRVVAFYPSPAGATECSLDLASWNDIAGNHSALNEMEPDVEGLLVNRTDSACDCYVAPIDECYKLVGLIRTHWRGLSGGSAVKEQIRHFFDELKQSARGDRGHA